MKLLSFTFEMYPKIIVFCLCFQFLLLFYSSWAYAIVPGDTNNDGVVDGIDYVCWLNSFSGNSCGDGIGADFNKDGKVDGVDYVIWLNNYLSYDLSIYYPNFLMANGYYLNRNNPRAVFWFEKINDSAFKVYNSAPENSDSRCHWDLLGWTNSNLVYYQTHDECLGTKIIDTIYDPPITFLPRTWNKENGNWSFSGSSLTTQKENNSIVCTGTNNYTASIIGMENSEIHWRTLQIISWDNFGSCSGWQKTNWQEDYWFTESMFVEQGNPAKAIKRTKGGNLDLQTNTWDISFDLWKKLPQ